MRTNELEQPAACVCTDTIVIGCSAGGFKALAVILSALPADFALPILLVQHLHPGDDGTFARQLKSHVRLPVIDPSDKERIEPGQVYVAPADYHMLVERDRTIALSTEERVHWSRPSIDVLFESAALALGKRIIALILSGSSNDGAAGIRAVRTAGGLTIAQDPATAAYPLMPRAAIDTGAVDEVLTIAEISRRLVEIGSKSGGI